MVGGLDGAWGPHRDGTPLCYSQIKTENPFPCYSACSVHTSALGLPFRFILWVREASVSLCVLTGSRCTSGETQINAIDFPGGGSQRYFVQMLPFSLQIHHCLVILCLARVSSSFLYLYPHASWQASCSAGYWEKKAEKTPLLLISNVVSFIGRKICYFYTTPVS